MNAPLRVVPVGEAEGGSVEEDAPSFEEFFRAEHAGLFRALCLVTGTRHEAEDVMQVAFMKVYERWNRVTEMEQPQGFLYRVAMNEFRSRYRRTVRAIRRTVTAAAPDDAFAAVEDRDTVIRALDALIPQQRAAIVLTSLLWLLVRGGRPDARNEGLHGPSAWNQGAQCDARSDR